MYTLDTVRKYPDKPCLIIMDEIFNSTNVVEAIAGAFSILENLASHKNVMTTITTHFLYLTKLKKQSSFECFCMNVKIDEYTNDIVYPYKLKTGISKQYVALELLKKIGF
jgi:DNA mismatch repair ATPase MutS